MTDERLDLIERNRGDVGSEKELIAEVRRLQADLASYRAWEERICLAIEDRERLLAELESARGQITRERNEGRKQFLAVSADRDRLLALVLGAESVVQCVMRVFSDCPQAKPEKEGK